MKLSIIIPVYNVEAYIEKCILSCLNQDVSHTDYEIIVINDGSPDSSLAIVERIANTAENVTIVSQVNKGLSAARNKGLSHAKGEYIWFVDSDDWIEKNCLGKLIALCDAVDFVAISFKKVWKDKMEYHYVKETDSANNLLKKGFQQPAQFYIMRRQFLDDNNLKFMEGVFHEDMEFTPRMTYLANKVNTTHDCVYNYLQRENSIMTTPNPKRAFDLLEVMDSLYRFKNEYVMPELQYVYDNIISLGLNSALSIISINSKEKQKEWIKEIKEKEYLLGSLKKAKSLKYKIEGYFFNILPMNIIIIYNLLRKLK